MFEVDRSKNRLRKPEEMRSSELNLREREHLQKWPANMPNALGEELLIIQKEFDGFADKAIAARVALLMAPLGLPAVFPL